MLLRVKTTGDVQAAQNDGYGMLRSVVAPAGVYLTSGRVIDIDGGSVLFSGGSRVFWIPEKTALPLVETADRIL